MTVTGNFSENRKLFFKKPENNFVIESTTIESVTYVTQMLLRETEWGVQNGTITKNAVLPGSALFF